MSAGNGESPAWVIRGSRPLGGEATDLLVRDGIIAETGSGLAAEGAQVLDATGLIALPGDSLLAGSAARVSSELRARSQFCGRRGWGGRRDRPHGSPAGPSRIPARALWIWLD